MIIKCEVCGGNIEKIDENLVGKCPYCKTINVISKNKEKVENLFNRATFLRQNNEYKKASEIYEEILKEDNNDAAAHWGLLLSKFGIEFIYDEKRGKKTATCHKLRNNSIVKDPEYIAAIGDANIEQQYIFKKEAKEINDIYERLFKISKEVKPFDIFISYKETDETGQRTQDSVEAQNIYNELTAKGYNVFFSRKTLENHLGTEYEPIIFSALRSSRVMILVGSSEKNINSPWVKNEWSRYLEIMEEEGGKTIIPCYFNMSPYDLPLELSRVQSLDLKQIGFMQDLLDGIDKIIKNKVGQSSSKGSDYENAAEYLYNKAKTYEKIGDFRLARATYLKMSDAHPEDYRAWWGLVVIDSKNFTAGRDIFGAIEDYAKRALVVCNDNERSIIEPIWESYYNKYYDNVYNDDMNDLVTTQNNYEREIQSLTNEINNFQDYSQEREQKLNIVKHLKDSVEEIEKKGTLSDKQIEVGKKQDNVFGILSVINGAVWIIMWLGSGMAGGELFAGILLLFIIIEAVLWGIFSVVKTGTNTAIKVKDKYEQGTLQDLRTQLCDAEKELKEVVEIIDYQINKRQGLENVRSEKQRIDFEIEQLKIEGKKTYKS